MSAGSNAIRKALGAALATFAAGVLIVRTAILAVTVATRIWGIVMSLTPIGRIIILISLLVGAVVYAWNHFKTFRTVVQAVFSAVVAAAHWLGGARYQWLWTNVIRPIWTSISHSIQWAWTNLISPTFSAIKDAVHWLGGAFQWLWNNVISPVWKWVSGAVTDAWGVIQPILSALGGAFTTAFGIAKTVIEALATPIQTLISGLNSVGTSLSNITSTGPSQSQINAGTPGQVQSFNNALNSGDCPPCIRPGTRRHRRGRGCRRSPDRILRTPARSGCFTRVMWWCRSTVAR